ncbi:hypothetical protein PTC93_19355 (plasmid) [Acinetobacter baumannii]|nr:hypothetical protein PTC93_19355 [Acinetobacter baumannii]
MSSDDQPIDQYFELERWSAMRVPEFFNVLLLKRHYAIEEQRGLKQPALPPAPPQYQRR